MTENLVKLVQDWLPNDTRLFPFYNGLDEFLEEFLEDFLAIDTLEDTESIQPKIIADPLLGYIHFTPLEVAIIDTKLFQRLRKISQLGLLETLSTIGFKKDNITISINRILEKRKKIFSGIDSNFNHADKKT